MSDLEISNKILTTGPNKGRIEIDTSLPFESVKAAVNLFGEKVDSLKQEKPKDVELKQELMKLQGQLTNEERRKEKALYKLDQAKKLLQHLEKKTIDLNSVSDGYAKECSTVVENEDKHEEPGIEAEEKQGKGNELEISTQKLRELKTELLAIVKERDAALEEREKTLTSIGVKMEETEVLKQEVASMNESLVLLKLACIEANRDKVSLLGSNFGTGDELELANEELRKAEMEHMLVEAMKEMGEIQAELATKREDEAKAKDAIRAFDMLRSELERTKMGNENAASSLLALSAELEETKTNLQKELDGIKSLTTLQESLKNESETRKEELKRVKEREMNSIAAASVLTGELTKIKDELSIALAEEVRAVESISTLSQAFEQVKAESLEAKSEAESFSDAAMKAKKDAEQAKSVRESIESLLKETLQESEIAKTAEKAAVSRVKSLSRKTFKSRESGVESGAGITISQDEYDSLRRKVRDSEDLSQMRVDAAMAQMEAVRTSEEEIMQKLATAKEDIESIRNSIKDTLRRVEMDKAAQGAVENELKRLREKEKKSTEMEKMAMASQQLFLRNEESESRPSLSSQSPLVSPKNLAFSNDELVEKKRKKKLSLLKSIVAIIKTSLKS